MDKINNEKIAELLDAGMCSNPYIIEHVSIRHKLEYIKENNIVDEKEIEKIMNDEVDIYGLLNEK